MAKHYRLILKTLMQVMSKLTPACEIITQKISQSMDHKISLADKIKIRIHVIGCKFCRRFEQQLIIMQKMLEKQSGELSSEQKLSDEIKLKLKRKLQQNHNN